MKNIICSAIALLLTFLSWNEGNAQNIRFSFDLQQTSSTTTTVNIYAQTTSGTENLTGYTIYLYYDNSETTVTGYNSDATTAGSGLGWGVANESFILHQAESNGNIGITHTGYFFYQNFDNGLAGDDITTTPTLLLKVDFDHSVGNSTVSGSTWLADTDDVPPLRYVNNLFQSFNVLTTGMQSSVLPVELLNFEAELTDGQTLISWQTASELDNDYFVVERSGDGRTFEPIDEVPGAGYSNTLVDYASRDEQPLAGVNYYRLRQVDFDGAFTYSDIRSVFIEPKTARVKIYPNPASDLVNLQLSTDVELALVRVFDANGRLVLVKELESGGGPLRLDSSNWEPGLYLVQSMIDSRSQTQQLIIQ